MPPPGGAGDELRAELDDIFGGDAIDEHAIDGFRARGPCGLGACDDLENVGDPLCGFRGKLFIERIALPAKAIIHGTCDGFFFGVGMFASPREATTRCLGWPSALR